jgi:hypothetical protein
MEPIVIITGGSIAAVIAAGAYLRWGLVPVGIAYRIGRQVGQWRASA